MFPREELLQWISWSTNGIENDPDVIAAGGDTAHFRHDIIVVDSCNTVVKSITKGAYESFDAIPTKYIKAYLALNKIYKQILGLKIYVGPRDDQLLREPGFRGPAVEYMHMLTAVHFLHVNQKVYPSMKHKKLGKDRYHFFWRVGKSEFVFIACSVI